MVQVDQYSFLIDPPAQTVGGMLRQSLLSPQTPALMH